MVLPEEGYLLRIFIGESDHHEGRPLYQWLVERAKERELGGATVLRGLMGFGRNSRIHTARILQLSQDLPIVVELVDSQANLEAYLQEVDGVIGEGLATMEKVRVRLYRGGTQDQD